MNISDRTLEQIVLELALLEVPCPVQGGGDASGRWDGHRMDVCPCHGTGQVARYPMLRKPCPIEECKHGILTEDDVPFSRAGRPHKFCQGRGWLPVSGAEATDALLEAALLRHDVSFREEGVELVVRDCGHTLDYETGECWQVQEWVPRAIFTCRFYGLGRPRMALALALEAAQEAHDATR